MSVRNRLQKRDKLIQKTMNVDDELYCRIEKLAKKKYDASISQIINACVYELADSEEVKSYETGNLVKHTIQFRESALNELNRLKDKYNLSIYRLVNIAMNNAIEELEE